jgi:hypothetical protein
MPSGRILSKTIIRVIIKLAGTEQNYVCHKTKKRIELNSNRFLLGGPAWAGLLTGNFWDLPFTLL